MLVGGGSQTPLLPERLADLLGLPKERVVIRSAEAIGQLLTKHEQLTGPDAVTPVGIALAAIKAPISSVSIRVNGQAIRLFEFRQVTVGDALLAADIDIRKLHGRPGMALTVEVHGLVKVLRGTLGSPATLLLNGKPAHLDDIVQHGDEIEVTEGISGEDAHGVVADVLPDLQPYSILFNGREHVIHPIIRMNGKPVTPDTQLTDRAEIAIHMPETLVDVLPLLGYSAESFREHVVSATVNGESRTVRLEGAKVSVNGKACPLHISLRPGDQVEIQSETRSAVKIRDVLKEEECQRQMVQVMVNGKRVQLFGPAPEIVLNGQQADPDTDLPEFATVTVRQEPWTPVFSHIFQYVHIDRERPVDAIGMRIELNGQKADFAAPLKNGDLIVIEWELKNANSSN
jgi:sulfur carrier protein ThiS